MEASEANAASKRPQSQNLRQIWNLWPKLHMQPCLFGLFMPFLEVRKKIKKEDETPSTKPVSFAAGKKSSLQGKFSVFKTLHMERTLTLKDSDSTRIF